MSTIPASQIVSVLPNVLAAGGSALDLIGLMLTNSTRVPIGTVQGFGDPDAVSSYFGATSTEKALADVYFAGFDDSDVKPGSVLIAQYPSSAVSAYLRGGNISAMTLTALQALSGTLSIVIDGALKTASISLAAATSFSNAALLIANGLGISGVSLGTINGSIATTTLTVGTVGAGVTLAVGDVVTGTGMSANTYITALVSGTGGVGTYTVNNSQTALAQAMTVSQQAVAYDSVSGAFVVNSGTTGNASTMAYGSGAMATSLLLTALTGAVLSQGTAAATPGPFMDAIVAATQNWATFMTTFNPDASGNANKLLFSAWANGKNNRFGYVAWDTDVTPTTTVPATASLSALIDAASYSGTAPLEGDPAAGWDATSAPKFAAFFCGIGASIDFEEQNGRTVFAGRRQSGLTATVTDGQVALNLAGNPQVEGSKGNGYSFYGAYATANDQFVQLQRGFVSGPFLWMDSFLNQIWLNNACQLALMVLNQQAKSIPFNTSGRAKIESALADPINAALNFGAIQTGVALSASQASAVNAAAGADIASTIENRGWYLQVPVVSATVRQSRGPQPVKLWYTDGESIQSLSLTSVAVL